jgi:hypothetical protein
MAKELNKDCPCTANCVRHGDCEACQANHAGGLTKCQRIKKEQAAEGGQ